MAEKKKKPLTNIEPDVVFGLKRHSRRDITLYLQEKGEWKPVATDLFVIIKNRIDTIITRFFMAFK